MSELKGRTRELEAKMRTSLVMNDETATHSIGNASVDILI